MIDFQASVKALVETANFAASAIWAHAGVLNDKSSSAGQLEEAARRLSAGSALVADNWDDFWTETDNDSDSNAEYCRLVDYIADKIGLPQDQELDTTNFGLWFGEHIKTDSGMIRNGASRPGKAGQKLAFVYFEVRPCIETGADGVMSFTDEDAYKATLHALVDEGQAFDTFWTLYGQSMDDGIMIAEAIGDFSTKAAAHKVMNGILAPMAFARDLTEASDIESDKGAWISGAEQAAAYLEDVINQSSNSERI